MESTTMESILFSILRKNNIDYRDVNISITINNKTSDEQILKITKTLYLILDLPMDTLYTICCFLNNKTDIINLFKSNSYLYSICKKDSDSYLWKNMFKYYYPDYPLSIISDGISYQTRFFHCTKISSMKSTEMLNKKDKINRSSSVIRYCVHNKCYEPIFMELFKNIYVHLEMLADDEAFTILFEKNIQTFMDTIQLIPPHALHKSQTYSIMRSSFAYILLKYKLENNEGVSNFDVYFYGVQCYIYENASDKYIQSVIDYIPYNIKHRIVAKMVCCFRPNSEYLKTLFMLDNHFVDKDDGISLVKKVICSPDYPFNYDMLVPFQEMIGIPSWMRYIMKTQSLTGYQSIYKNKINNRYKGCHGIHYSGSILYQHKNKQIESKVLNFKSIFEYILESGKGIEDFSNEPNTMTWSESNFKLLKCGNFWENINALFLIEGLIKSRERETNISLNIENLDTFHETIIGKWLLSIFSSLNFKNQANLFFFSMDKDIPVYIYLFLAFGFNIKCYNNLALINTKWKFNKCRELLK